MDWRISDHRTILMNHINKHRLAVSADAKLIDEASTERKIQKYAKEHNLDILTATDELIKKIKQGEEYDR